VGESGLGWRASRERERELEANIDSASLMDTNDAFSSQAHCAAGEAPKSGAPLWPLWRLRASVRECLCASVYARVSRRECVRQSGARERLRRRGDERAQEARPASFPGRPSFPERPRRTASAPVLRAGRAGTWGDLAVFAWAAALARPLDGAEKGRASGWRASELCVCVSECLC